MKHILLTPDDKVKVPIIGRRTQTLKLVDSVMAKKGAARWEAIRSLWLMVDPQARQDDIDAREEATQVRKTLIDPEYGRTRQTLGIAYGERGNKNTNRRLLAVLPENLKTMLRAFDREHLMMTKGEKNRKYWREVYRTFPEYRVTEKL